MPPSYITFQARWRIFDGTEQDVWRFNLALAALIRSRMADGDYVSVTGPCCAGLVNCADLRAGLRAINATLDQLYLRGTIEVHWLDLSECIWRGIDCSDRLFEDLELA